jgi:hypothetical protein
MPDKQEGDADKDKIVVIQQAARVPGDDKNTEGNDNAEYFSDAMEKEIAVPAGKIQGGKDSGTDQDRQIPDWLSKFPYPYQEPVHNYSRRDNTPITSWRQGEDFYAS